MKRSDRQILGVLTLAAALLTAPVAVADDLEQAFDHVFRNTPPALHAEPAARAATPGFGPSYGPAYASGRGSPLDLQLAALASAERGRIGVAASVKKGVPAGSRS